MEDEESGLDDYDEEGESEFTDLDAEMEEESGLDDDSWDEEGESESILKRFKISSLAVMFTIFVLLFSFLFL